MNKPKTKILYDNDTVEIYDYWVGNGYYDYPALAKAIAEIAPSGSNILEIGIGTGSAAIPLLKFGRYSIDGIDQSPYMLQKLQEKLDKEQLKIDYHQQSVEEINLDSKYDVIFSVGGPFWVARIEGNTYLHSYVNKQNLPAVLRKLNSLLNAKGCLMINIQKHGKVFKSKLKNGMDYEFSVVPQGDNYIIKTHYFYRDGKLALKKSYKMLQMNKEQLIDVLQETGFSAPKRDGSGIFLIATK